MRWRDRRSSDVLATSPIVPVTDRYPLPDVEVPVECGFLNAGIVIARRLTDTLENGYCIVTYHY